MSIMLRAGALALALLAGTALTAAPAMAGYDRHGGWNNKSWNKSWNGKHGYRHGRKHHGYAYKGWNKGYGYRKKGYGYNKYGWGKGWFGYGRPYYGSPYYYGRRPGFSIYID